MMKSCHAMRLTIPVIVTVIQGAFMLNKCGVDIAK